TIAEAKTFFPRRAVKSSEQALRISDVEKQKRMEKEALAKPQTAPAELTIPVLGLSEAESSAMALGKLKAKDPARYESVLKFFGAKTPGEAAKLAKARFDEMRATKPPPSAPVQLTATDLPEGPRPMGIIFPSSIPFQRLLRSVSEPIGAAASWVREVWRGFAMKQAPKITDADRASGEAGVRYAASFLVAKAKGLHFARQVLEGLDIAKHKFGVALSEDNLRGLKDARIAAGDTKGADAVTTLIGRPNSP